MLPIRRSVEVHMIVAHQEATLVTVLPPDQGLFHDLLLQDPLRRLLELDRFRLEEPLFLFKILNRTRVDSFSLYLCTMSHCLLNANYLLPAMVTV